MVHRHLSGHGNVHIQNDRHWQPGPHPDTFELDAALLQPLLRRRAERRLVGDVQAFGNLDPGVGGEEGLDLVLDLRVDEEGSRVEVLEAVDGNCTTVKHGPDARQGAEGEAVDLVAKLEGGERKEVGDGPRDSAAWDCIATMS